MDHPIKQLLGKFVGRPSDRPITTVIMSRATTADTYACELMSCMMICFDVCSPCFPNLFDPYMEKKKWAEEGLSAPAEASSTADSIRASKLEVCRRACYGTTCMRAIRYPRSILRESLSHTSIGRPIDPQPFFWGGRLVPLTCGTHTFEGGVVSNSSLLCIVLYASSFRGIMIAEKAADVGGADGQDAP